MRNIEKIVFAIGLASLVGCSSANTSALPVASNANPPSISNPVASSVKTGAVFVFTLASAGSVKTQSRSSQYLPANSGSIGVTVKYAANATTGMPGATAFTSVIDPTTCPVAGSSITCRLTVALSPDSYTADIFDYTFKTAVIMSQSIGFPFVVNPNAPNAVTITLAPVIASLSLIPNTLVDNQSNVIPRTNVIQFAGTAPSSESIVGIDAGGNVIPAALQPTCSNITATSSNNLFVQAAPLGQTVVLTPVALSNTVRTIQVSATCVGSSATVTGSASVLPVEELLVVAGSAIDRYGSFASGLTYLGTTTIPGTNVGGTIRVDAARKVVYVMDVTSGTFYSVTAGGAPVKLFTSSSAVASASFAIAPDASSFYVSNRNNNAVYRIPFAGGTATNTYSVSQPIEVDFDTAGNLYAAEDNFNGTIAKLAAGATIFNPNFITGSYYPVGFRVGNAAEGGYLYTSQDNGSGGVVRYSPSGTTGIGGAQASSFAFNAAGDVYMVNAYLNPATITKFSSGSSSPTAVTAVPGSQIFIRTSGAAGEAEFII